MGLGPSPIYRSLDATRIHATVEKLAVRVDQRFPGSSLAGIAAELVSLSRDVSLRLVKFSRPHTGLRMLTFLMLALIFGALLTIPFLLKDVGTQEIRSLLAFIQVLEPALGTAVFLGAFTVYLLSRETERKRRNAFDSLHEVRSMAHVVDMHQLTKDPASMRRAGSTEASPVRHLSDEDLTRYLDYCTEMLALLSKLGALHAQDFPDAPVIQAVDEIEDLCTGLSRKIWQKLVLIGRDDSLG